MPDRDPLDPVPLSATTGCWRTESVQVMQETPASQCGYGFVCHPSLSRQRSVTRTAPRGQPSPEPGNPIR